MNSPKEPVLGNLGRVLKRYWIFLVIGAVAVVLIGVVPALTHSDDEEASTPTSAAAGGAPTAGASSAPDCDPETGKLMIPSRFFAPPCVSMWTADDNNGGATARGVTATEIKLVVRVPQSIPPGTGISDTTDQIKADLTDWVKLFNRHFETYGRTVTLSFQTGTGEDAAGQRADAIQVASEQPFATIAGGTTGQTYDNEAAARDIVTFTTFDTPQSLYEARAPYLWGVRSASEQQLLTILARYVGKRLAGHDAQWAGDPEMQSSTRKFGLLYPAGMDQNALKLFNQELGKYGVSMVDEIAVAATDQTNGADPQTSAQQAQAAIDKLRDEGVNVVVPFINYSALLTAQREATAQHYFPEWVVTPYGYNTTTALARYLDPAQTAHMYGLSIAAPPVTEGESEPERLFRWEYGRLPQAKSFGTHVAPGELYDLFLGIQMAGPNLNPKTFQRALFDLPAFGGATQSFVTTETWSYGPAANEWPFDNYTGVADVAEVWWDPGATGIDESGHAGQGMFQYANGGKRLALDDIPSGEPNAFDPRGAVVSFGTIPPAELAPDYPNRHCERRC
ncbi:hypothetical protein [Pseudofrankia sp. BMG5.37]|uniref:hypothetical protein n=1 Tax=Pseudofrankia sp. BMG5.37 TaxID=3050035 RepID=UPI002894458B|nr:hypothetical protein [Pseudofrankia sp. BMG5.37]MDT3439269.1 hypothetical protein [Pseudofrankia sp. BMG5.37]